MLRLSVLFGPFHWAENALWPHFQTFEIFSKIKKRWNLKLWFLKTVHQRVSWGELWTMCQNSRCRKILNALRQELLMIMFDYMLWYGSAIFFSLNPLQHRKRTNVSKLSICQPCIEQRKRESTWSAWPPNTNFVIELWSVCRDIKLKNPNRFSKIDMALNVFDILFYFVKRCIMMPCWS